MIESVARFIGNEWQVAGVIALIFLAVVYAYKLGFKNGYLACLEDEEEEDEAAAVERLGENYQRG